MQLSQFRKNERGIKCTEHSCCMHWGQWIYFGQTVYEQNVIYMIIKRKSFWMHLMCHFHNMKDSIWIRLSHRLSGWVYLHSGVMKKKRSFSVCGKNIFSFCCLQCKFNTKWYLAMQRNRLVQEPFDLPGRLCVFVHKWHLRKQTRALFYLLCPTQHLALNSLCRLLLISVHRVLLCLTIYYHYYLIVDFHWLLKLLQMKRSRKRKPDKRT